MDDLSPGDLSTRYDPSAFSSPPPIPVHVLSGFLGTGKTTAIRDLLARHAATERIAVIVNEFGDLGVDGALLSDCISCILKEVPGGCVCCTAMRDLEASIEEMLAIVSPTRLVVEPTGLARASELVDLFRSPRFGPRFELRPVVTMLDPRQDPAAAYAKEPLFRDQVEIGDVLVLNFADLSTAGERRRARAFAEGLRPPKMAIVETSRGVLPADLLELRLPATGAPGEPSLLPALASPARGAMGSEPNHAVTGAEGFVGRGWLFGPERLFDAQLLQALVQDLAEGRLAREGTVARAKGIFRTTAGWVVHEIAGGRPSVASTPYRRDSRVDVIVKSPGPGDFAAVEERLREALVPEEAPLLVIEDAAGFRHAFHRLSLERLVGAVASSDRERSHEERAGRALRLDHVLEAAGVPPELGWAWLVAERGMFGVGAPRALLAGGLVYFEGDGEEPYRFVLPDALVAGHEDDVEQCRDVPGLCSVRVVPVPGDEDPVPRAG